jgi:hypothetical protein
VPLSEDVERYEVDLLLDGNVRRSLASAEPSVLYSADQEAADFGRPQSTLSIRIAQISSVAGRGFERVATIPVL